MATFVAEITFKVKRQLICSGNSIFEEVIISDALRDLVPFEQF